MKTPRTLPVLIFIYLALMSVSTTLKAQNFEGDSIYYTPISRSAPATVERNVTIFRDTTEGGRRITYYFDLGMGLLTGCADCANGREFTITLGTTHGIIWGRKTRIGGGVGVDTYVGWKTVPLYGSLSYDLVGTKNTHAIFVQGQYGWGFAWRDTLPYEVPPADEKGGIVLAALIGYRIKYHDLRIAISTGFKQQTTASIYETDTWIPNEKGEMVKGTPNRTTVETTMGRATLNLIFTWR